MPARHTARAGFSPVPPTAMATAAFFNLPAHGHTNPTLGLTSELVRQGDRVLYWSSAPFRAKIEATGAEFRDYGTSLVYDFSRPDANLVELAAALLEAAEAVLPELLESVSRDPPDYVLHDSMCPWGSFAGRLLGVPVVCSTCTFALHPMMLRSSRGLLDAARELASAPSAWLRRRSAATRLRAGQGIQPGGLLAAFRHPGDLTLVHTSRRFQPFGERFDGTFRFVGPSIPRRSPPRGTARASSAEPPLVYVSLGTLYNHRPDFYRDCLAALAGADVRVVLSAGSRTEIGSLGAPPPNVAVAAEVPQLDVLERASAFLTHGGMNSVSEGLWFGVPLVVFPQTAEQALVGRRVQELGAGRLLKGRRPGPAAIREAVRDVLTRPRYRAAAESLGDTFVEAGGALRAGEEVERFKEARGIRSPRLLSRRGDSR